MNCPSCGSYASFEDGFCRVCGIERPGSRLPVHREPAPVPALWRSAAPVVARGAALVIAGIAAEWLMRTVTKRAVSAPMRSRGRETRPRKQSPKERALARRNGAPEGEVLAFSETIITRRMIFRR